MASRVTREEEVAAALGGVRAWIPLLEVVKAELLRAAAAIEPTPAEVDPEVDLDCMDWPTEVRSVLGNVAESYVRPMIENLRSLLPKKEL